jgi:hypothetical protein
MLVVSAENADAAGEETSITQMCPADTRGCSNIYAPADFRPSIVDRGQEPDVAVEGTATQGQEVIASADSRRWARKSLLVAFVSYVTRWHGYLQLDRGRRFFTGAATSNESRLREFVHSGQPLPRSIAEAKQHSAPQLSIPNSLGKAKEFGTLHAFESNQNWALSFSSFFR